MGKRCNIRFDLHFVFEVIIAVATLLTSIKACEIANKQTLLVNEQLEVQKWDKQPLFEVHTDVWKVDSTGVYDTEILKIYNVREATKDLCKIDIKTYYELVRHKGGYSDTLYVPIQYYFVVQTAVNSKKGELTMAYGPSNNSLYHNFYKECMYNSRPNFGLYYFSNCIHLISISYKDFLGESCQSFFINELEVSTDDYYKIISNSENSFHHQSFSADKVRFEDVVGYFKN